MKKIFYLLFLVFSFCNALSQDMERLYPTSETIDQKLKMINSKGVADQDEATLLQLKARSERLGDDKGVLRSGDLLMRLYYGQGRYKAVTELGDDLKNKIKSYNNPSKHNISNIYRMSALALSSLGLDDASQKDFKTAVKYADVIESKNSRLYNLSLCYENMTVIYNNKHYVDKIYRDSIMYYLDKSLDNVKRIGDNDKEITKSLKYSQLLFIDVRLGIFYLEQSDVVGSTEKAERYLLDALRIYDGNKNDIFPRYRAMMMNQLSWLYMEKKEPEKSIDYANRALELEKANRDPHDRVESYEFLADSYLKLGENDKSAHYNSKYLDLRDSLAYAEKNNANVVMKKLVSEVNDDHVKNRRKLLILVSILVLVAAFVILLLWRRKNKLIHKKYEQMIEKLRNDTSTNGNVKLSAAPVQNSISSDTEKKILLKLEAFENSGKFLKKDVTLGFLANQFNTNTKYLSEVINKNRSQSFSNYINSLRIDYVVHKLYNEPKYREYKISYLAEESGFASPQVFIMAFKKVYGVTPFYFIQKLKEEEALNNT